MKNRTSLFLGMAAAILVLLLGAYLVLPFRPRPVVVTGVITKSNGEPVVGAWILFQTVTAENQPAKAVVSEDSTKVHFPSLPSFDAQTDAQGAYALRLIPGRYSLAVRAPPDSELVGAQRRGLEISTAAPKELNFVLETSGTVKGTVKDETGSPIPDADVWIDRVEGNPGMSPLERLMLCEINIPKTGKQGGFSVSRNLATGKHLLVVVPPEGKPFASHIEEIECVSGKVTEESVVLKKSVVVVGRVIDSTGGPAAKATVLLIGAKGRFRAWAEVGPDGVYRIGERICPGRYGMRVLHPRPSGYQTIVDDVVVPEDAAKFEKNVTLQAEPASQGNGDP